ncbi:MAG: hypothetical protein EKK61_00080 [Rickettsiales bacterium]|nr:MAG: hypothetical protein EKK61_00080 [Rickettsiales bacterium]
MRDELIILDNKKTATELFKQRYPSCEIKEDLRYRDDIFFRERKKKILLSFDSDGKLIKLDLGNVNGITATYRDFIILYTLIRLELSDTEGNEVIVDLKDTDKMTDAEFESLQLYYSYYHHYQATKLEFEKLIPPNKREDVRIKLASAFKVPVELLECFGFINPSRKYRG